MNLRFLPFVCAAAVLAPVVAVAEYHTDFATPPYVLNSTVVGPDRTVGIDGWRDTGGSSTTSAYQNARVVAAPWEGGSNVLRVFKETSDDYTVRLINNSFEAVTGLVELKVGMAFDFPVDTNRGSQSTTVAFRDLSQAASPIVFGLDFSSGGGLYYKGEGAAVVLLGKNQLRMNAVYEFTLTIDFEAHEFDINIAGQYSDGSAFNETREKIAFADSFSAVSLLYVGNSVSGGSAPSFKSYITHIDLQAVPEPGSVALLLGGAGVALGAGVRKFSLNRK